MNKIKEVFYKNRVYRVPEEDTKFINDVVVVQLTNGTIVYWDDLGKDWFEASQSLIEQYTNKKYIDVEINGEIVKSLSHMDLEEEISDKKVTMVNIECVVSFDEGSNAWKVIDKQSDLYKLYTQIKRKVSS